MLDLAKNISPLQEIKEKLFEEKHIKFFLKRDDLLHSQVSGNKWRKLKYNLRNMQALEMDILLTFGGAFSNHIYSTAAAGKLFGFKTIGIIRGDELNETSNATLKFAAACGMKLFFVSRTDYRNILQSDGKIPSSFLEKYGIEITKEVYILPEGGTNKWALKGVSEMVDEIIETLGYVPTTIATALGSGGTLAGICAAYHPNLMPLGIAVVGEKEAKKVIENVHNLLKINYIENYQFSTNTHYNFGAYAKTSPELIGFIKQFEQKHEILLEQVYTGKLLFALYKLIEQDYFKPNSCIVSVHTGGLQGRNF